MMRDRVVIGTGERQYTVIQEVISGKVNDVYVCSGPSGSSGYHTVWLIKDRAVAKHLASALCGLAECFMERDMLCFVFPYEQERPLERFYYAAVKNGTVRPHEIWLGIVTLCMTCGMCHSLIYLMLSQGQVSISADGGTRFQYFVDLSDYDADLSEEDSVRKCAGLLLELMEMTGDVKGRETKEAAGLILKKYERKEYREYIQLYMDMKLLGGKTDKTRFFEAVLKFLLRNRDLIFKFLLAVCIVLVAFVCILLISRLILGDFAFYRLWGGPIKQIGTESLLQ